MKNIEIFKAEKYNDTSKYEFIEENIYEDLNDTGDDKYRLSISFELEENEDTQYPMEDILNKFMVYVSDLYSSENKYEFAGCIEDIRKVKSILGKRVFNRNIEKDGKTYISLVIE